MPTYEYRCSECGYDFETFQKFSEDPLTVCPMCGGLIKRVLHAPGIVFKGSGWYVNDSRKPSSDGSEKSSKSDGDSAPKPSTESKSQETKTKEPASTS